MQALHFRTQLKAATRCASVMKLSGKHFQIKYFQTAALIEQLMYIQTTVAFRNIYFRVSSKLL